MLHTATTEAADASNAVVQLDVHCVLALVLYFFFYFLRYFTLFS